MSADRRKILVMMCFALATVVSAVSSLNVALPDLARDTGATPTELQWIVDAYALVFAGLLLPAGALGDRLGRRRVLLAGLAIFGTGAAIATTVSEPSTLIAIRAVMGVGAALIMPTTLSIITASFPAGERDRAVGAWAGVAGGSALLGLLVSGAVLEIATGPGCSALSVVLAADRLRGLAARRAGTRRARAQAARPGRRRCSPRSPCRLSCGPSSRVRSVAGATRWSSAASPARSCSASRSSPGSCVGVSRCSTRGSSSCAASPAGSLSIFVQFFAAFGLIFVLLQFLQLVLGYSPLEAGAALAPMALVMVVVAPRVPRLVERVGVRPVGPTGLGPDGGRPPRPVDDGRGSSYWHLLAGGLMLGLGMALATTPATTAIVGSLPAEKQGVASAVNDAAREVGGALGHRRPRQRARRSRRPAGPRYERGVVRGRLQRGARRRGRGARRGRGVRPRPGPRAQGFGASCRGRGLRALAPRRSAAPSASMM